MVVRGAINKPISFSRNAAPGAPSAGTAPSSPPASAPAADKVPALPAAASGSLSPPLLGLTLIPVQGSTGVKIASVTPNGLAATTGV